MDATSANGEVPALRTEYSDTYAVGDGTYRSDFSPTPINVKQPDGSFVPITASTTPVTSSVPSISSGAVSVADGAESLSQTLHGASSATGSTSGSTTTFANALAGTTVAYTKSLTGLKETLTLASAAAPGSFTWSLRVGSGQTLAVNADNSLSLKDSAGSVVASIPAPWMRDASGTAAGYSTDIAWTLTGSSPSYTLTMTPSASWLADAARVFPVTIDPSVIFQDNNTYACEYTNPSAGSSGSGALNPQTTCSTPGGSDNSLAYGDDKYARRIFIRFPDVNSSTSPVPADAVITDAQLVLTEKSQLNSSTLHTQVYRPYSSSWNSSDTWSTLQNSAGTYLENDNPSNNDQMEDITITPPGVGGQVVLKVAPAVRDWVNGVGSQKAPHAGVQNGLEVRADTTGESNLSNLLTFYGLGNATSTNRPHLTVFWQPQVGKQSWLGQYTHKLTDKMSLAVDYADRDLVLSNSDDSISSPGESLSIQRTYNSLNAAAGLSGAFGAGWQLNGGQDVSLTWNHNGAYLIEPDGGVAWFARNYNQSSQTVRQSDQNVSGNSTGSDPSFWSSPGINADLTKPSTTQYKVYFHKSHTTWTFTLPSSTSATGYLSSISDDAGNAVNYTVTSGQTTKVTDSTGQRSVGMSYTSGVVTSMAETLASGATGARSWTYGYTSGALTSYVNAAGDTTTYCYTSGLLTKIITPRGVAAGGTCSTTQGTDVTDIAYDSAGHVTSVSYENGTSPAITVSFAVGTALPRGGSSGTTTVTDPYSNVTTYHYDTSDRTTQSDSPLGYHRSATYNTNNDVTASVSANNFTGSSSDPATSFGYDASGNANFGNLTSIASPTGANSSGSYDTTYGDRPTSDSAEGADPYQPSSTKNDLDSVSGSSTQQTSYKYDKDGQVTTATLGDSSSSTPVSTLHLYYDGYNYGSSHCGPSGAAAYKGALCKATDADYGSNTAEHRTLYSYNSLGELVSKTTAQPDNSRSTPPAITYTYDGQGRLASMTDATGVQFVYTYDALDRLTEKNDVTDGVYTTYAYDKDGDLTDTHDYYSGGTTVSGNGHDETWTYDALNREISDTQAGLTTVQVTWDANSRMATYSDGLGGVTSYGYDADGRLISMALWGGSCSGFGATDSTRPTVASNCITFALDNSGHRTKAYFPASNGTETWTYDKDGKITEVVGTGISGGSNTTLFDYTYDYTGHLSGPTNHVQIRRNPVTGQRDEYSYDNHSRLTGDKIYNAITINTGTQIGNYSYCYDAANNLTGTSTTVNTACSGSSRSFDGANEILGTNHTFNIAGSETTAATDIPTTGSVRNTSFWGPGQQPYTLSVNGGTSLNQDFLDFTDNTMLYSDTGGGDSDILLSGPLGLDGFAWYNSSTGVNDQYGYARDPSGQPLAMRDSNGTEEFFLADNQGSVLDLVGTTGTVVDAYHYSPTGTRTIDTNGVAQPLGYLGAYTNRATGLVHLGARFYDPTQLAFTQTDPQTHNSDPTQDNPYAYAGDDPINNSDPGGQNLFDDITSSVSFGLGAVGTALDATGVGGIAGAVFGGLSAAVGVVQAVGDCTGLGDANCEDSAASAVAGVATFGVSTAVGKAGSQLGSAAVDGLGDINSGAATYESYSG